MPYQSSITERLKSYLPTTILIWLAILFYRTNKYYSSWLSSETQSALIWLALAYTLIGFIFFVIFSFRKEKESRGLTLIRILKRLLRDTHNYIHNFTSKPNHPLPKIDPKEKTILLFVLVKIFFLPLMLNFFFDNIHSVAAHFTNWQNISLLFSISSFNTILFPLLLSLLLTIDTSFFIFGYSIESSKLKNQVRSVEPTFFGWIVALICYPPFNDFINNYLGWYANDYTFFWTNELTVIMRILILFSYGIYVWASVALGAKASNLTNRGIVSRGPYAIVRHPAYISKNFAWCLSILPVLTVASFWQILIIIATTTVWIFIYYLRAITEERHLIKDPDYQAYCRKVKYRFIPGVY